MDDHALIARSGGGQRAMAVLAPAAIAADPAKASRLEIVRDEWGIAHIHGHTGADAGFGTIHAEAEPDLSRIEALVRDLRARLPCRSGRAWPGRTG